MRVEVAGLSKRFGEVTALRDVSFEIPAGHSVALVGPNGSGKSTLNRALMGLVACEGSLRLDGRSPVEERLAIAKRMAYVPQIAPQLAAPVRELVAALLRVRGLRVEALEKVAAALDLDLEAVARRSFRGLSGGTKQKLLIALALATPAELLILDEPTGSLDARSRERFFALLRERTPAPTLLLCSHRMEELRHRVDRVLVLEEGRLVHDGPADAWLGAGQ